MNDDERDDQVDHGMQHDELEDDYSWSASPEDDDAWSEPEETRDTDPLGMIAALAVGVVATLLVVLLWNQLASGEGDQAPAARADALDVAATGPVADDGAVPEVDHESRGATRLSRCVRGYQRLQAPLDAAQASLDQWSVHVGAMNKLVVGEITLKQATDFWNDTRVGARRHVQEFDDGVDDLRRQGLDCPDPGFLAPGARALPSCARAVQASMAAFRAARVSIATWDEHIHHMDMLRLGQMTPEEATNMWLVSWKQGVRELEDFAAASREAKRDDGCAHPAATE